LCKEPLFGNIVQLLCNENFNRLSCRCTPITSANDGASCGFAVFRRAARKWPDPSTQALAFVGTNPTGELIPDPGIIPKGTAQIGREGGHFYSQHVDSACGLECAGVVFEIDQRMEIRHCGSPTRRTKSWKRGSERNGSSRGSTRSQIMQIERAS
jgi:hypothetical protein